MTALHVVPDPYPTALAEVPCEPCAGTGKRRTLLSRLVDCDSCAGDGTVQAVRPKRSVSPDAPRGWDGTERRAADLRKIVVTLPDGMQLSVGRYCDNDAPDVIVRSDCGGRWMPASMAGIDVEDRSW